MPDKIYKFISVCEREKPIQTNNRQNFLRHVAFCPACQEKLPPEVKEQLEPELSEQIAIRAQPPKKEPIVKVNSEEVGKGIKKGIKIEAKVLSPEEVAKQEEEAKKVQFDGLVKDSPSFKNLAKSVGDVKGDVKKLSDGLSDLSEQLTSEISSLGDTIMQRMTAGSEEGGEKPLGEEPKTEEIPPGETPPGRGPGPFGEPGEIPAAMREDYKPGETPPPKKPPPSKEEPSEIKEPEVVEPPSKGGGLPDLDTPEQVEAMEAYLEEQKKKFGEKKVGEKLAIKPWLSEIKENVKEVRGIIDAIKGEGGKTEGEEEEAGKGAGGIGGTTKDLLELMKAVNDLTISNVKGIVETMRSLREGEKLLGPDRSSRERPTRTEERKEPEHM